MQPQSPKSTALLNFIRAFIEREHYPPTFAEMQTGLGWTSKSVVEYHIAQLERAGCIARKPNSARSITVVTDHADRNA